MSRLPDDLAGGCRRAQVIGGLLVLALASYWHVVEMIRREYAPFSGFVPGAPVALLRLAFAVMAVLGLVVAKNVRSKAFAGRRTTRAASADATSLVPLLLTASILTLAMCEATAIYGVVLFMIGGGRGDFYGFAALALLEFAVYFPRLSQWEAWAQQA